MTDQRPTLGCIVLYRTDGRNELTYDLPAIITCTRDSHPGNYPDGSENPLPVPESHSHVHLTVFTPGGFGTQVMTVDDDIELPTNDSADFVGAKSMTPGSGTYVEWNVRFEEQAPFSIHPRTWRYSE